MLSDDNSFKFTLQRKHKLLLKSQPPSSFLWMHCTHCSRCWRKCLGVWLYSSPRISCKRAVPPYLTIRASLVSAVYCTKPSIR